MKTQEYEDQAHPSHAKHLSRLNRIAGQIAGVQKMIRDQRYCPEILIQLHAARAALRNLEVLILNSHLSHCVLEAFENNNPKKQKQKIEEIQQMIKRFD
jgi:CsoR family transcriptional regulator, copper-sensing transcriptional repressor